MFNLSFFNLNFAYIVLDCDPCFRQYRVVYEIEREKDRNKYMNIVNIGYNLFYFYYNKCT